MSYAFSSNINSAAVIRGDISLSIGEPDDYFDDSECLASTVFKDLISEYEKAKKFFLESEAEHHCVTVEQLKSVLAEKIKPE